jgi:hypothetical protein
VLEIAGFLHFEEKKLGRSDGFLFLAALKPHLVFLWWIALLLWSIRKSKGRTLVAFGFVTLLASVIALALEPAIFAQFLGRLTGGGALAERVQPQVAGCGSDCRSITSVQAVPAAPALLWVLFRWGRAGDEWQWREPMPVLRLAPVLPTS